MVLEGLPPIGDNQFSGEIRATGAGKVLAFPGMTDAAAGIPSTPPVEVLDALDRAARVMGELERKNVTVSLHYDGDESQLRIDSTNSSGESRELSVSGLLNLLDGDLSET